ncbi:MULTISPECIES: tetratricopeptide repeat protein [unclassified Novosphingobium]|uniref:tetratricopeptide repeat protein n=1 Tax=unclassified Novosphingobium TaxID=2644732 RepID=UPI000EEAD3F8|nr:MULTISPECIES: tetratricopeptide repeat protein [unclassified Novosphingobium]HCF25384.1 hypothetical protein [Novosphingobium sp.]HQV04139.1 tetratricopeptide repeat protein [Novosphingobium sp.]
MPRLTLPLVLALLATPLLAMPDDARTSLDKARAALARGDGIAAEADLQRALAAGARKPELAADMGEALIQQGEGGKARAWLAPGQFDKGEEARGWRLLALLERLDGNLPAAGRALDRALVAAPRDPLVWVEVGRLRYQGGEQLQAFEAADRAVAAGPNNPRALELKAQLVRDSLGDGAALPIFEQALAGAPGDIALLGGYAASLGELGRASEMLAVIRKMLSLDPDNGQAFYLQAVLAARAGNVDLARAMLNRAGERIDGMPAAALLQGMMELEAGNANAAVQHLIPLANGQPANPRVQLLLARALYEAGDHQQLVARFGALAARGDASPYLLQILGQSYEEQGDRAAAGPLLDRAAAANPPAVLPIFEPSPPGVLAPRWNEAQSSAGITAAYLRSLLGAGDQAGAVRVAGRLLELRGGSAQAHGLMGDVELAAGRADSALRHYDAAARVRLTESLALRSAIALEQLGQGGKVPALVVRYLGLYPQSRLMLRIDANLAIAKGDWARARLLLENLRLRGANRDARLLASLSLAQLRSGDAAAALATADRAWSLAPASGYVAAVRALTLAHVGSDPATARQLIAQAGRTGGDPKVLDEARRKLR